MCWTRSAIPLNITSALTIKTPHSSPLAIEVRGLRKSYGTVEAVRGIDLQVSTGEVFALLGPNGAGKTTTMEILEGYLDRTAGDISVLGYDPSGNHRSLKERIGIVLQTTGVQPYLNVEETVNLFRGYYPQPAAFGGGSERYGSDGATKYPGEATLHRSAEKVGCRHRTLGKPGAAVP